MAKQALHFFRECPPKLAQLIEFIRLLPAKYELPEFSEGDLELVRRYNMPFIADTEKVTSGWDGGLTRKVGKERTSFAGAPPEVLTIKNSFKDILDTSRAEFRNYIVSEAQGRNEVNDLVQMIVAYSNFIHRRESLRMILHAANPDQNREITSHYNFAQAPGVFGMLRVDDEGLFTVEIDELYKELEGVEANRIRDCKVCRHIFWAGRSTQKCCNPTCSNTFRVQRHRYKTEEEKAAYIERRIKRERARHSKQHTKPK